MVGFYDCCFVVLIFTRYYLPTQDTQLCKLCLQLSARSSASYFELAIKFFSSWISRSIAQTLSLRSSSSLSKRSSLWELVEISVLASRAAFLSLTSWHFSAISAFKEACEQRASILRRAFPLWSGRGKMSGRPELDL
jgi:hypothetical protein